MSARDQKQAEIDYPHLVGDEGREWLRNKPFRNDPWVTARFLIDFAHVLQILDLHAGMSLVELGCGPGWMTRFAARHGLDAVGYDIAPEMIAIARELAEGEAPSARFEVGDMEQLDLGRRFDAVLLYDALHHSPRADLVLASAHRALRAGGRLLLVTSSILGLDATLRGLEAAGLRASVVARERGPLGPLMSGRRRHLERAGMLAPGQREEDVLVVRGVLEAAAPARGVAAGVER